MPLFPWPALNQSRTRIVDLPVLSLGSADVTITWDTPMPDATYTVQATVELGVLGIGKITPQVKQGSITPEGCVITLSITLVSLAAGSRLHVIAYG